VARAAKEAADERQRKERCDAEVEAWSVAATAYEADRVRAELEGWRGRQQSGEDTMCLVRGLRNQYHVPPPLDQSALARNPNLATKVVLRVDHDDVEAIMIKRRLDLLRSSRTRDGHDAERSSQVPLTRSIHTEKQQAHKFATDSMAFEYKKECPPSNKVKQDQCFPATPYKTQAHCRYCLEEDHQFSVDGVLGWSTEPRTTVPRLVVDPRTTCHRHSQRLEVKYGQPVPQLMLARHVHETEYRRGKNYVEGKKASF